MAYKTHLRKGLGTEVDAAIPALGDRAPASASLFQAIADRG
jgi:hypothetical protein